MTIAKVDPSNNAPVPQMPRFDWQKEETLVEQRRRSVRHRISRFFGRNWLALLVIGIVIFALLNASVMTAVLTLIPFLLRFIVSAGFIIMQFALMFWFLGRSRMYTIWPGQEGVSFKDYRGQPEILEQAQQIVKLLRGVKVFEQAGGEPLNGLLLEGPPGTGKTWLAQAISTEAGVPFFFVDASSMNSMFVGIAPLKVAGIYRKARRAAKEYGASVIFIDEIDAIGSRGGVATSDKGDEFREANRRTRLPIMFGGMGASSGLLSTLLIEMSGFSLEHGWWAKRRTWFYKTFLRRNPPKPQKRVLTIGATNRITALDAALLRPGRFDKKIRVDVPDLEGRRDIIDYYLSKMAHDDSIDPLILASETPYYTPAALKYLLNEALRVALFDGRTYMTIRDIRVAQPEHEFGLRSPIKNMDPLAKRRLAAHEAGHAVAVRLFMPTHRIARVTIIRQGAAMGYVLHYPATEDMFSSYTYEMMMNRLRIAVAGKAGEMEYVGTGDQTLGVGGDFQSIRAVLYAMANAGMFGMLGATMSMDANPPREVRERMEETFRMVLDEVRLALRMHRPMGEALIDLLLIKEELLADDVEKFFDQYGFYTPKVKLHPDDVQTTVIVPGEAPAAAQ